MNQNLATKPTPQAISMADLFANFQPVRPRRNTVINGEIVAITADGALVDIGAKSESIISHAEVSELSLTRGQKGSFLVMSEPDEDGHCVLSMKAAQSWTDILSIRDGQQTEQVVIRSIIRSKKTDRIAGAIAVIRNLRGFIPASELSCRGNALENLAGQTVNVKVLEADPTKERGNIVLSQKQADAEEAEKFFASVTPGQIVCGKVTGFGKKTVGERQDCYGAFVDLGCGISGLVHKSELSSNRTLTPEQVVAIGQELTLVVLNVNAESRKVSLSLKQAAQSQRLSTLTTGQVVQVTVARKADFGIFVDLGGNVDGLIHVSELPGSKGKDAMAAFAIGQTLEALIIKLDVERKQVGLSITKVPAAAVPQAE